MELTLQIVAAVLMFIVPFIGVFIAKLVKPGTYLIYAQTFASAAFMAISLFHFLPEAILLMNPFRGWPMYSVIMTIVLLFFSLAEMKTIEHFERRQQLHEVSDEIGKDFSIFLMHRFTIIPSFCLQMLVFFFLIVHAIIIGFAISFRRDKAVYASILVATLVEKMIESFTITLVVRKDLMKGFVFWILLVIYACATPASIIAVAVSNLDDNPTVTGSFISISAGVFLFIGLMLWRKTFLTPFDWKKREIAIVCVVFIVSIVIQALTTINQYR